MGSHSGASGGYDVNNPTTIFVCDLVGPGIVLGWEKEKVKTILVLAKL